MAMAYLDDGGGSGGGGGGSSDPPGVGSTPATITTPYSWYVTTHTQPYTPAPSNGEMTIHIPVYDGVNTVTSLDSEILLSGPLVSSALIPFKPYVKSSSLTIQKIESYEPIFLVKSTSWYKHTIALESTCSNSFSYEVKAGIDIKDGACSVYGEGSQSTTTTTTMGWEHTAENGAVDIIYIRMIFLRVFGSVTYNKGFGKTETRTYDATILALADINNYCIRPYGSTYNDVPPGATKYYDHPSDGDSTADKFYSLSTRTYSYSDATTTTTSFGIELDLGNDDFSFTGSAKFTWTTSTSVSIKHTFVGSVPSSVSYYYICQNNFFNVNLDPR